MSFIRVCMVLLALSLLAGCVAPEDGGSTGGGKTAGARAGKGGGTITVCGEKFTLGDIVEHPMFRQSLRQFVTLQQLYAEASKKGITITDEQLNEELNKQKEQITSSGQSWDEFLKMQGMSEDEVKQMLKTQKMFEALIDTKLDLSDERLKKYWEENKDQILTQHIQANFLPESERQTLTYETCIDTIKESIRQKEGFQFQQELMDELTLNATLDLSGVLSTEQAAAAIKGILGDEQDKIRERKAAEEKPVGGETATPEAGTEAAPGAEGAPAAGAEAGATGTEGEAAPSGDAGAAKGDNAKEQAGK
jgi:hypothetical protein